MKPTILSRGILAAAVLSALSLPLFADTVTTETTSSTAPTAAVTTETVKTSRAPIVKEESITTTTTEGTVDRHDLREAAKQERKAKEHEAKAQEHTEKALIDR